MTDIFQKRKDVRLLFQGKQPTVFIAIEKFMTKTKITVWVISICCLELDSFLESKELVIRARQLQRLMNVGYFYSV